IGAWTKAEEEALLTDCQRQVDEAAEAYLATGRQPAVSMLDHLHETLPHALEGQRRELEERGDG
ncbi:MAG: hypothetical protein KC561_21945, partial [Myxococcales bacterium]|nr:hypothetical protein [Myxococcales bacterium]